MHACVWPCARVHLTRPAGDARLNSARTLASPKALSSTHKTGKRRGRMGRTPISCKIRLICCITNNTGNVWSGKEGKKKKDCFYLKLEEIVAGRSEAGCVTEKANGVDEEKRSLQEKSRETTEADLLWRLWVVNLVSLSVEQVHIILWITYQYYRAHKLGDNRLHRKPLIVEHCDWTSQCQLQTVPVKGGNRGQRIKYSNSTGCSRLV